MPAARAVVAEHQVGLVVAEAAPLAIGIAAVVGLGIRRGLLRRTTPARRCHPYKPLTRSLILTLEDLARRTVELV